MRAARITVERDAEAKACTVCGETKPLDAFGVSKKGRYGRRAKCKPCYNAVEREKRYGSTKRCSRCEKSKPLDCFASSRVTKDGLYPWCRMCKKASDQRRIRENGKYRPGKEEGVESIFAGYSDERIFLEVHKLRRERKRVVCPAPGCESKARLTSPYWPYCELHRDTAKRVNLKKLRKELV